MKDIKEHILNFINGLNTEYIVREPVSEIELAPKLFGVMETQLSHVPTFGVPPTGFSPSSIVLHHYKGTVVVKKRKPVHVADYLVPSSDSTKTQYHPTKFKVGDQPLGAIIIPGSEREE